MTTSLVILVVFGGILMLLSALALFGSKRDLSIKEALGWLLIGLAGLGAALLGAAAEIFRLLK